MPTVITKIFKPELINGSNVNLSAIGTYNVALMNNSVNVTSVNDLVGYTYWNAISGVCGVTGTGYSDVVLASTSITYDGNNVKWDASDTLWENISVSAWGCCIYRASDTMIVGFVDFGSTNPKVTVNGSLTIQWNDNGIMNII